MSFPTAVSCSKKSREELDESLCQAHTFTHSLIDTDARKRARTLGDARARSVVVVEVVVAAEGLLSSARRGCSFSTRAAGHTEHTAGGDTGHSRDRAGTEPGQRQDRAGTQLGERRDRAGAEPGHSRDGAVRRHHHVRARHKGVQVCPGLSGSVRLGPG